MASGARLRVKLVRARAEEIPLRAIAIAMAITHLVSGLPCSGKTTYATALRADRRAALFSLDRWLITLFGRYAIDEIGHAEHVRRVLACRTLIWDAALELLHRDTEVILDDGFFIRENRMRVAEQSKSAGASAKIHYIDTPLTVIRARLEKRNAHLPPFNFRIPPDMLHAFAALFEAPRADEGAELVIVRDVAGADAGRNDADEVES
jgi:predicted kinase